MKILKFGGSSVADAGNIRKVVEIIRQNILEGNEIAVVVSAMGGMTDRLVELCRAVTENPGSCDEIIREIEERHLETARTLLPVENHPAVMAEIMSLCNELSDIVKGAVLLSEVTPRTKDLVLSFGERLSAYLITEILRLDIPDALYTDARKIIRTDSDFGKAKVDFKMTEDLIKKYFFEHKGLKVITGFIGSDPNGQTTTLGRSGSDYTATIVAYSVDAESVEIWSDADGVMTADPHFVPEARSIEKLSYSEAMELSHFGARILFPLSLHPAMLKQIPVRVKNTFNPEHPGTLISRETSKDNGIIKGITSLRNISIVNVEGSGMVGVAGISARLFTALSQNRISVILISQASSEHSICIAVKQEDAPGACAIIREAFSAELASGLISSVNNEDGLAIVAVVGENMRHVPGVAARVFNPLGRNGINIKAISQGSSELNISFVISGSDLGKALRILHQALFSREVRRLHIYMAGTGAIGSRLMEMIHHQQESLLSQKIELKICGLINTRKMLLSEDGIDPGMWKTQFNNTGVRAKLSEFVGGLLSHNFENSIFIDATASDEPVVYYEKLLSSNVSIVAANKRANTGRQSEYNSLKINARKRNVSFNYETNVGAGLPVINVIRNLQAGGDEILKIEAVLSGTVNWLLSEYDGKMTFSELVRLAREKGITEPYPGDDLLGLDVARKCLILARECGLQLEPEEVDVEPVLPAPVPSKGTLEELFSEIEKQEHLIFSRYIRTTEEGKKLRYVALIENGAAKVRIIKTGEDHPFFSLRGSENCLIFTTKYYSQYPLVVKGPGAGVDVTSAGLLADIVRIAETVRLQGN